MRRLKVYTAENGISMHSAAKALGVEHLDVSLFIAAPFKATAMEYAHNAGIQARSSKLWSPSDCNQVKAMCTAGLLDNDGDIVAISSVHATSPIVQWLPGDRSWTLIGRIRSTGGAEFEVSLGNGQRVRRTVTIEFDEDVAESDVQRMIECGHLGIAFGKTGYVNGRIVTRVEVPR